MIVELLVATNVFFASNALLGQYPDLNKGGCIKMSLFNEYLCWKGDDHAGGISEDETDDHSAGLGSLERPDAPSSVASPPSRPPSVSYDKPDRDKHGHRGKERGKGGKKGKGKGHGSTLR